jgi:hypothetical protein
VTGELVAVARKANFVLIASPAQNSPFKTSLVPV